MIFLVYLVCSLTGVVYLLIKARGMYFYPYILGISGFYFFLLIVNAIILYDNPELVGGVLAEIVEKIK